jgi:hypothetical protein
MDINGYSALIAIKRGLRRGKLPDLRGEVKVGLHCGLMGRFEGGGARDPAGNNRRP